MSTPMSLVVVLCCFGLMSGALRVTAEEKTETVVDKKASVTQSVFLCPHCQTMSMKAGKCVCGKELKKVE